MQAALQREFVFLKIDVDRDTHGQDVLGRFGGGEQGLPWFLFLDAEGQPLITSTGPEGNVGCPWRDQEIAYFGTMLRAAAQQLSAAEIERVLAALPSEAKERAAKAGKGA